MKPDGMGRETNDKRLLISGKKLRVAGVEGWSGWATDMGEGTCCSERRVLCKTDES